MQSFKSFDALVAGQSEVPAQTQVSSFNTSALSDSFRNWFEQHCVGSDFEAVDITFADALRLLMAGEGLYCLFASNKGILGADVRKAIFAELADRGGIDYNTLYATWSKAKENKR